MKNVFFVICLAFAFCAQAKVTDIDLIKKALIHSYPKQKFKTVSILKKYGDEYYVKIKTNKFCHKRFMKKSKSKTNKTFFYAVEEAKVERCAR